MLAGSGLTSCIFMHARVSFSIGTILYAERERCRQRRAETREWALYCMQLLVMSRAALSLFLARGSNQTSGESPEYPPNSVQAASI